MDHVDEPIDAQDVAEPKPPPWQLPEQRPKRKRKPPKSAAERLAEIHAEEKSLLKMVEDQRMKLRTQLVNDLYEKFGVPPTDGDLDERKRLSQLRAKLGL